MVVTGDWISKSSPRIPTRGWWRRQHSRADCCGLVGPINTTNLTIQFTMNLSTEEVQAELKDLAYSRKDFEQVIKFIWALPKCFWSDVCKRFVATVIVGIQDD